MRRKYSRHLVSWGDNFRASSVCEEIRVSVVGMGSTQKGAGHRLSESVVLGVFVSLLIFAGVLCAAVAHNIPYSEDWLLVSPLTGNEPDLGAWAWRLHHDHRIPLPKLLMLSILKVSGGDFRWVVASNVGLIGSMCGL